MSEKRQGAEGREDSALDALLLILWPQVKKGDQGAIDRVLRVMERRALDAPTDQGGEPGLFTDEERVRRIEALLKAGQG
jgi:hypothetical protein